MTKAKIPAPPKDAGPSGRALWNDVLSRYELEQHEERLLVEMVRAADELDELHAILKRDGLIIQAPHARKAHPALGAAERSRIVLARLSASLRLPSGDEDDRSLTRRPQRRGAARGPYSLGGLA